MGDVGSVTLGLALALFSQVAHSCGGSATGRRWSSSMRPSSSIPSSRSQAGAAWRGLVSPHREHNYQLLVRGGWSHTASTLTVLAVSAGCCRQHTSTPGPGLDPVRAALLGTVTVLTFYAIAAANWRRSSY